MNKFKGKTKVIKGKLCHVRKFWDRKGGVRKIAYSDKIRQRAYGLYNIPEDPNDCWAACDDRYNTIDGSKKKFDFTNMLTGEKINVNAAPFIKMHEEGEWPEEMQGNHCDECYNRPMCANPLHLYWGDQKANMHDKKAQGTQLYGEEHGMGSVPDDRVLQALITYYSNPGYWTVGSLAECFGIERPTMQSILNGYLRVWMNDHPLIPSLRPDVHVVHPVNTFDPRLSNYIFI